MIHELKCIPEYFEAVTSGDKTFEVRKNDRPFAASDFIALNEYSEIQAIQGGVRCLKSHTYWTTLTIAKDGLVTLGLSPCRITMKNHMYSDEEFAYCGVPVYGREGVTNNANNIIPWQAG